MSSNDQQVIDHLLRVRAAEESFLGFVQLMQPDWKLANFQHTLIDHLDNLEKNTLDVDCLLITMPPRHAKSTFGTVFFPSYFMARDPRRFTMSCSYNSQLSLDFGRQVREVVEDKRVAQAFPNFRLSQEARAADVWRTQDRGGYFAVGIGGTTSGRPANILLVDDPLKSRDDAESVTQRNKVWNYYTSALTTRLQPQDNGHPPKQIIILTRWHPDDLAGRLMETEDWAEGRWRHINFQAITERTTGKLIARKALPKSDKRRVSEDAYETLPEEDRLVDETERVALWPERFSLHDLYLKERMNAREFASLYQQQPYIEGGNLIKSEWWRYYPRDLPPAPDGSRILAPENFVATVIGVDTAFKKTETADYSVAVVASMDRLGDIYIMDILRSKFDFPELKQAMIRLNTVWRGRGLRAIYIEDKASGQSLIQELRRESGMSIIPYKTVNDKVARVNSILPLIEGGRVFLPEEAPWLDKFIAESLAFPEGANDDQVDALTIALDSLSRTHISADHWNIHSTLDQSGSLSSLMDDTKSNWKGWGLS